MIGMNLLSLIDDILLAILAHCEVRDILSFRQTCKQLDKLTRVRAVWLVACEKYVLKRRLPFFSNDLRLDGLESEELERRTCLALRIAKAWTGSISRPLSDARGHPKPSKTFTFDANSNGNPISELRFCPKWRGGQIEEWLLTVAKGIWSEISCWDLSGFSKPDWKARNVGKWTRKGALIRDVIVNKDFSSEACLAVSLTQRDSHRIEILGLRCVEDDASAISFDSLATFESIHRVITLDGDICATSNDTTEVHVLNWRTKCFGVLKYDDPAIADTIPARCLQVAFAHECIIVGFARSISLYPAFRLSPSDNTSTASEPIAVCNYYQPLATCKIDWTDCMSIVVPPIYPSDLEECVSSSAEEPYSAVLILLRAESDDPWASNFHIIMHYKLHPDRRFPASEEEKRLGAGTALGLKTFSDLDDTSSPRKTASDSVKALPVLPYEYPPAVSAYMSYHRGFLRCPDLAVGPCGTALWVHPRTRSSTGLVMEDARPPSPDDSHSAQEWLCGTVLPAAATPSGKASMKGRALGQSGVHRLWTNPSDGGEVTWTSLDYVESLGWIGLGGSDGSITLLRMVDV